MAEYNFKTGVDAGEYRDFLNVSPAYCFTQLPEWSEVKDNWDHDICMLYKDGAPAVGALLLIRHLPMGKKLIYSPRRSRRRFRRRRGNARILDSAEKIRKEDRRDCR